MKTSIVIPMWNEEAWVEQAYQRVTKAINENKLDAQIVFATDGCTDRTVGIIQAIQKKDSSVILYNHPTKLGRGRALKRAFKKVDTPYIVFMDSDLATDLKHLPQLIDHLDKGADIVTGSRLMKGSECKRSRKRNTFSRVYNFLARFLFRSKIHDHQCGFKGFNRTKILKVLDDVKSNGWFWDAEILLRGQKEGLEVVEFPVSWSNREDDSSKVNLWKDARRMGIELLLLRVEFLPMSLMQMLSFAGVGVSNTLISLATLWILENTIGRGDWGYYFAYAIGIINSFILNRKFTFREKGVSKRTFGQFAGFVAMYLAAMIIYSETARFLEVTLGFFYLFAALASTAVEFIFTFTMSKVVIFRKRNGGEGELPPS
ncbi:MAG: glycosyltransferase [Candidatus Thorarchaeota archaeon]|jgi:glycosyltransferase involved in cell wall biosynthesis